PNANATRRQWALLAMILLTMPTLAQVVFAASHIKPTTEEAIKMPSSPASPATQAIDYHGVVYNNNNVTEEAEEHNEQRGTGGGARGHSQSHSQQHGKSRMNMALYPPRNKIPDVNSPQVKAWIAEIDWSKVPNVPVAPGLPETPHFPKCPPISGLDRSTCWWSCNGCTAPTDVITCPSTNAWGLTYDDGPSWVTRDMTRHLQEKKLTAMFFVVGSRVLEFLDVLREQVAQGHHIAMHTWSHSGLTTLTNHEIVAEIRWTEKAIRDVTGLTMKYVRPPFGDIDSRVRENLRWDTNDWRMLMYEIPESEIITNFKGALDSRAIIRSSNDKPAGPITLEHDLSNDTVRLSRTLISLATARRLQPMNIATCLGDPTPYQRGSKLGPGGAVEKINGGDGTGSYRGMAGMEEQDYNVPSEAAKKAATKGPNTTAATSDAGIAATTAALQKSVVNAAMGLTAVASFMLML
ncbi:chitin deacetylase, partial [Mortierella sp. AD031]